MSISSVPFPTRTSQVIDAVEAVDRRMLPLPAAPDQVVDATAPDTKKLADAMRIKDILLRACETTDTIATRLVKIKGAQSLPLEAVMPLTLTLSSFTVLEIGDGTVTVFHGLLVRQVEVFQQQCSQANLPREQSAAAGYALCTALDKAANNNARGGGIEKFPTSLTTT